ncbi:MAG: hypothetical protein KIT09_01905 [Bryobacteraceae bacterium]|nr:hypothetical protein [Bryobacteraceae bacterium]
MKRSLALLFFAAALSAEMPSIPSTAAAPDDALDPASTGWKTARAVSLALHRTPPLYATDAPAAREIDSVQVQLLRGASAVFVRLEWADPTRDEVSLPGQEKTWVTEKLVTPSEATDRFSDSVAVMIPAEPGADVYPSLQMGDRDRPVRIYFVSATRGAAVMEATGRGTTHRTGERFPARLGYAAGKWAATMQLQNLPAGAPLSFAVWNGSQQDRDGRKYFTVWYTTE